MKKLFRLMFLLATTILVMISCGDDEKLIEETKTKAELLTQHSWKLKVPPDCEKDDVVTFYADGTYVDDPGDVECDFLDVNKTGTWKFVDGSECWIKIEVSVPGVLIDAEVEILELTEDEFQLEWIFGEVFIYIPAN